MSGLATKSGMTRVTALLDSPKCSAESKDKDQQKEGKDKDSKDKDSKDKVSNRDEAQRLIDASRADTELTPGAAPPVRLPPLARTDPETYAALRPVPLSAVAALGARLQLLPSTLDFETRRRRINLILQACTHPSFVDLQRRTLREKTPQEEELQLDNRVGMGKGLMRPLKGDAALEDAQYLLPPAQKDNLELSILGNHLLGLLSSEVFHLRYPHLPVRALKAAVGAYVGPNTLSDFGGQLGISSAELLKWDRVGLKRLKLQEMQPGTQAVDRNPRRSRRDAIDAQKGISTQDVLVQATRALMAVVFQEMGLPHLRHLVQTQLLTRSLPMSTFLKFRDPKRLLSMTCSKYDLEAPVSRLIAETGRLSQTPVFIVGIWSGETKLGEGTGSAIRMAEFRAAEDALRRLYLAQPSSKPDLPSRTLDSHFPSAKLPPSVWEDVQDVASSSDRPFVPSRIGRSEIVYGQKA
ncbi:Ribonuclease III domain proteins [Ceraceosorus bombacis]|uniref:Large ribosomal subunit protein mL44 n=1 Tax=Ceraceosorus bombacis TaxID=401625 RepID=A0A0P1BFV3_9BASI|nr:Ribonuclease III domain proteins [Ceraceosorus bombacis]